MGGWESTMLAFSSPSPRLPLSPSSPERLCVR
jgi:hypothetical protein